MPKFQKIGEFGNQTKILRNRPRLIFPTAGYLQLVKEAFGVQPNSLAPRILHEGPQVLTLDVAGRMPLRTRPLAASLRMSVRWGTCSGRTCERAFSRQLPAYP